MTKLDVAILILEKIKKEKIDNLLKIFPDKENKIKKNVTKTKNLSRIEILRIIDLFIEILKEKLVAGERIDFRGFGSFQRKLRKAKKSRNPKTKEVFDLGPYYIPFFKPSKEFKSLFKK